MQQYRLPGLMLSFKLQFILFGMSESEQPARRVANKLETLTQNIDSLTKQIERREVARKQKKMKQREQLNELYDAIEQKSSLVVSKIEDLTRKPTIIVSVQRILPEIPEGFPKNYNIQIVYEDVVVTGNQKFVDFDENIVEEKFILPLLSSEQARMQVWVAEEEPSIYDKALINLEADIEAALEKQHVNQVYLQSSSLSVSYQVELQGIGFQAWLKNIRSLREAEQQRRKARRQAELKHSRHKQKVEQKKSEFNSKFKQPEAQSLRTQQFDLRTIQDIIGTLGD